MTRNLNVNSTQETRELQRQDSPHHHSEQ